MSRCETRTFNALTLLFVYDIYGLREKINEKKKLYSDIEFALSNWLKTVEGGLMLIQSIHEINCWTSMVFFSLSLSFAVDTEIPIIKHSSSPPALPTHNQTQQISHQNQQQTHHQTQRNHLQTSHHHQQQQKQVSSFFFSSLFALHLLFGALFFPRCKFAITLNPFWLDQQNICWHYSIISPSSFPISIALN